MKKRRKSIIKFWSKIIVVCLAPFRDRGTKTAITGLGNFRVEWVSIISIMSIISLCRQFICITILDVMCALCLSCAEEEFCVCVLQLRR
jgi:hypothetical protein